MQIYWLGYLSGRCSASNDKTAVEKGLAGFKSILAESGVRPDKIKNKFLSAKIFLKHP